MTQTLDSCLVRQCAPTLAGVKIGNLFCVENSDGILLCNVLARWNASLNPKGVYARVLAEKNGRQYIYVYRKNGLIDLCKSQEVRSFLKGFGYLKFDVDSMLNFFQTRMTNNFCFPHEVGIFLGYPLNDVRDFIAYGGKNYKQIGCWKIYNDVSSSMKIFEVYKKCQKIFSAMFERGTSLECLIV